MNKVILDASALLALIKNEAGAVMVERLLGNVVMSSINVSEVAAVLLNNAMTLEECQSCILPFISQIIPFDHTQAFQAAALRTQTKAKGLSLGDRACIALGITLQLPIYTADKVWSELQLNNADIRLIR